MVDMTEITAKLEHMQHQVWGCICTELVVSAALRQRYECLVLCILAHFVRVYAQMDSLVWNIEAEFELQVCQGQAAWHVTVQYQFSEHTHRPLCRSHAHHRCRMSTV